MSRISAVATKNAKDFDPPYSPAETFAIKFDNNWEIWKDKGNDALKAKDSKLAARLYTDALFIILEKAKSELATILKPCFPLGYAGRRVLDSSDCLSHIVRFIDSKNDFVRIGSDEHHIDIAAPNLPAAICYSNRATAFFALAGPKPPTGVLELAPEGKEDIQKYGANKSWAQLALEDALQAVKICGEYEKGHQKLKACYLRMGMKKEYEKKSRDLQLFDMFQQQFPTAALGMCLLEWIDMRQLQFLYIDKRRPEFYKRIKAPQNELFIGAEGGINLTASMVPYLGGQALTIGATFMTEDWNKRQVDSLWFQICDPENGHDVEKPPNGIISPRALKEAMLCILVFSKELKEEGISLPHLMLGQGLVDRCDEVKRVIENYQPHTHVYPSMQTHASDLAAGLY